MAKLTKRERQVAELIAWGLLKKEVAAELSIEVNTVNNICRSIYEKTGVTKANELSAWWFTSTYNIDVADRPHLSVVHIKKWAIALLFLAIVVKDVFSDNNNDMRMFRARRVRCRTSSARGRSVKEYEFNLI